MQRITDADACNELRMLKDSGLKALRLSFFGVKGFEGSRGLRLKGFRV